jgi:hypothetical protein
MSHYLPQQKFREFSSAYSSFIEHKTQQKEEDASSILPDKSPGRRQRAG